MSRMSDEAIKQANESMRLLPQRLRDGIESGAVDLADIMDAADEIERLRGRVAELEQEIEGVDESDPVQMGWIGSDGRP